MKKYGFAAGFVFGFGAGVTFTIILLAAVMEPIYSFDFLVDKVQVAAKSP